MLKQTREAFLWLGIPAALHANATLNAECADCGEKLNLRVSGSQVTPDSPLAHFLVPFRH